MSARIFTAIFAAFLLWVGVQVVLLALADAKAQRVMAEEVTR